MRSGRRLPDGVEWVALGLAVGSGLSLLSLALQLLRDEPFPDLLLPASIQAGLALAFGILAWGLFYRGRWAFLTVFAGSLILTTLAAIAWVAFAWDLATFRDDCHYGNLWLGMVLVEGLLTLVLFIVGMTAILLWRDRRRF